MADTKSLQFDASIFQTLAENAPDAILVVANAQGTISYANRAAHQLFGHDYEKRELFGACAADFWLEEDLPFFAQTVMPQTLAGGWSGEVRQKRADGSVFYALSSAFPLQDTQNQFAGVALILHDLSAHKHAETALSEERNLFQTLMDTVPDTIYFKDTESRFIRVNQSMASRFGFQEPAQILGKTDFDIFTEEHARPAFEDEQEIIRTGNPIIAKEEKETRADGTVNWVSTTKLPLRNAQGEIIGTYGISRDISARRRAEEALRKAEAEYRFLVERLPDTVIRTDPQGAIQFISRAFMGLTPGQIIGKNLLDLATPEQHADIKRLIEKNNTGETASYEFELPIAKGPRRWLSIRATPIVENAAVLGMIILISDVTATKRAEAERAQLQEQVIEAQRHALQELSTPIIPVLERIIVMPLIGSIDSLRAKDITRALLAGISAYRAKIVIVDITGVPLVDSGVADHLNRTIQAARLKGARTIITGMSDAVAEAIVDLGIDWSGIQTLSDLQSGLLAALNALGYKLNK